MTMTVVALMGIGQCEDVCSNVRFPRVSLQAHKFLPQQGINKSEFQPRH
jgi:hypothetical protein